MFRCFLWCFGVFLLEFSFQKRGRGGRVEISSVLESGLFDLCIFFPPATLRFLGMGLWVGEE